MSFLNRFLSTPHISKRHGLSVSFLSVSTNISFLIPFFAITPGVKLLTTTMSRRGRSSAHNNNANPVMGPPPDRDTVMGPPPVPSPTQPVPGQQQQKGKESGEIIEKYRKLKRRYFELDEVSFFPCPKVPPRVGLEKELMVR